jgi:hypothetical protein
VKLSQESGAMLRINLIYYGNHTPQIDSRILSIRPQYVIVNSAHGLWSEITGTKIFQNIGAYKAAGIKVIGYITAGYEETGSNGRLDHKWYTLAMNQTIIKNMAEIDRIDGVFIDECSAFPGPGSQTYLKTLTELAHNYGLIAWGNVGQAQFDRWFFTGGGFDLMQSNEDWNGQSLSEVQRDWGNWISVTGSKPGCTPQDAYKLTVKAWQMGFAFCYITDSGYATLPSWLEAYSALIQSYEDIRE